MRPDRIQSFIGLAAKAGKTASGEFAAEKAVKSGKAYLVIVACDASANSKKKFSDMCRYYKVPIVHYGDKEMLGYIIGKEIRAMIAVTDPGFAVKIEKMINEKNNIEKISK